MRGATGRILITGCSGSGKSALARYLREHGVPAVDGDSIRGLNRAVDLRGRPLRRITKDQWRRADEWQHFWVGAVLKRFLAQNPNVVLCGASDNMFDLDLGTLFDRRIFLRASWSLIRARLDDPVRDNNWGQEPGQREWIRKRLRSWPTRAQAAGFEFVDAALPLAKIFQTVSAHPR